MSRQTRLNDKDITSKHQKSDRCGWSGDGVLVEGDYRVCIYGKKKKNNKSKEQSKF